MGVSLALLNTLQAEPSAVAWQALLEEVWKIYAAPLALATVEKAITQREQLVGQLDLLLASSSWDLWQDFETSVESTADALGDWWGNQADGKAILILDALSLREVPWILQGAEQHGFTIHQQRMTRSELPSNTTPFAKALGFNKRADLQNNGASNRHRLTGAYTECGDWPWLDCANLISSQPNWVFWHEWPDSQLHHQFSEAGQGERAMAKEAAKRLSEADFWAFIKRLTTGRRLIITSDHGYAASGLFANANDEQNHYLKPLFKKGRWSLDLETVGGWVPPLDVILSSKHGRYRYVLGRRKWKPYPTLVHGGLSLLEVAVPFIELSLSHS